MGREKFAYALRLLVFASLALAFFAPVADAAVFCNFFRPAASGDRYTSGATGTILNIEAIVSCTTTGPVEWIVRNVATGAQVGATRSTTCIAGDSFSDIWDATVAPGNYTITLYCDGATISTKWFNMIQDSVPPVAQQPYFYNASDPMARPHTLASDITAFMVAWDASTDNLPNQLPSYCTIRVSTNGSAYSNTGWATCWAADATPVVGLPDTTYCYIARATDRALNTEESLPSCITIAPLPPPAPCKNSGEACAASSECCLPPAVPDPLFCDVDNAAECKECIASGGSCSTNPTKCCTGFSCTSDTCQAAPATVASFCPSGQFNGILQMCGIAALGMASLVAFVYIIGQSFSNARMLTWAKTEAMQVFVSLVIVGMVLWVLSVFCEIQLYEIGRMVGIDVAQLPYIYQGIYSSRNIYDGSILYLENLGAAGLENIATLRYDLGAYEIRSSYNKFKCDAICIISMSSISESLFGGETMKLAITNNLLGTATIAHLSTLFQYFTMLYIVKGLFIEFLPLAIVMRSIPFMRQFGGALIAIFVSLYLLYPSMLVLDAFVAPGLIHSVGQVNFIERTGVGCGAFPQFRGENVGMDLFNSPTARIRCMATGVTESNMQDVAGITESSMNDLAPGSLDDAIRLNTLIFLAAVFLPALNFIVIAALARDLSRFLGEESDISRLGQMV